VFEYSCSPTQYRTTTASANPNSQATCTPPTVTTPGPSNRPNGSSTYYQVAVNGTSPSKQWQVKTKTGSWTSLSNVKPYSGVFTDKLIINPLQLSMDGNQYRCSVSNNCGSQPGGAATLTVTKVNSSPQNGIGSPYNLPIAEPIQVGTKTYIYKHTDFNLPVIEGNLSFTRYYNSLNRDINSPIGYGWTHSYSYAVQNSGDTIWDIKYPDGHSARFISLLDGTGSSFPLYAGTFDSLVQLSSKEFRMYTRELNVLKFDSNGRFYQMLDVNGNQTSLTYTGSNLTSVTAPGGRALTLAYNGNAQLTSVTTPLGRVCRYGYDGNGDQVYALSPNGDTTRFTYSSHKIISIIDALGNTMLTNTYNGQSEMINQADAYNENTAFAYNTPSTDDATVTFPDNSKQIFHHDSSYRLVKSVDAYGEISTIAYDENNNPDTAVNEIKQLATFQYDAKGNALIQTLPGGKTYQIKYNKYSKPTEIVDPRQNKSTYTYDNNGNLLSVKLPDNSDRYFAYNSDGSPKFFVNGNGDTSKFSYNSSGDLTKLATPTGNINYSYDTDGRLITITDPKGNPTTFSYDYNNNILSIKDALNQYLYFTYDKVNQLTTFKNKRHCTTRFYYDKKGRMIARKNAIGGFDSLFYDVVDNMIKWKDALGHETHYAYDSNARRTSVANFAGMVKYEYDALGNLIKFTDPNNHVIQLDYSDANLIDSLTDALNQVNRMFYDSTDNLVKRTDYRNKTKNYEYDPLSRLSKVIDVDNEITLYNYDSIGNMKTLKDGNQHTQNFVYGKAGLLKSYKDGASNSYSFTYDSSSNIKTVTKPIGSLTNTYDALNRLTKVQLSSSETYNYTYDANNNITSINNSLGTSYFFYDSLDRMVKYKDLYNKEVQYGYNAVGSVTRITYPGGDTVHYDYDNANRLIKVLDWKQNAFTYKYDSSGRVTKLTYPTGMHCDYKYDATGRILSKYTRYNNDTILYGQSFAYFHDSVIELRWGSYPKEVASENVTNSYRADDAFTGNAILHYVNDNNGNRTKEIKGTDTIAYTYSIDQLLLSSTASGVNTIYGYDALGHRVKRKAGSDETRYVLGLNGPLSLVLQTTNSGGNVKANYIYGLGLLEQIDSNGNELFYHFDSRHNTIAITDKEDSVKATYAYLLYGTLANKTGNINQPFTFLGEFGVEQETNSIYYIRARYYDAASGRFLSKDPLFGDGFEPQTLNRYIYALNSPLEMYDITGLFGEIDFDGSTGAVNPKLIYEYLRSLNVSHIHALGLLANIKGESDFYPGANETKKNGTKGPGVGLFQYSDNERKPSFLKAVPDYKTNWQGQIKYAINEDRAPEYLKKPFSTPEEAAEWWMNKWERPAAENKPGRRITHNNFIISFGSL
jgi:RHS repeat-associated protein